MAITFLTSNNENIYDITKKLEQNTIRPEKYISIFRKKIESEKLLDIHSKERQPHKKILESKSKYSAHKTMGYAETPYSDPCNFLRKNHGIKFLRTPLHKCEKSLNNFLPMTKKINTLKAARPAKNFKKINAQKARFSFAKTPLPKVATTFDGHTVLLCNAGIMPAYIFSPSFGKVPKYLTKIKKCLENCESQGQKSPETRNKNKTELNLPKDITIVSDEIRKEIASGLKSKWIEIMDNYQACPVYADTIPQKIRRTKIENQLRQIEQDLLLIENNPYIYICEANNI